MKGTTGRPKRARPAAGRRVGAASPRPDLLAEFVAELLDGHKGPAVLVPFDPQDAWQTPPRTIENPAYGKSSGHLVRGTLNGHPFDGWIGCRWGRFFLLVGEDLQKAARVAVGDSVRVVVGPRSSPDETKRPARTEEPGTQPARWASRRGRDEARTKTGARPGPRSQGRDHRPGRLDEVGPRRGRNRSEARTASKRPSRTEEPQT